MKVGFNQDTKDQIKSPVYPDLSLIPEDSDLIQGGELSKTYFRLQDYYAKLLLNWLNEKVEFQHYEEILEKDAIQFVPAQEYLNWFHRQYSFGKGFFYLRNILCIERLTAEELSTLRELAFTGSCRSNEGRAFVDATLHKLCTVYDQMDEKMKVVHEPDGKSARNFSVILGLSVEIDYDAEDSLLEEAKMERLRHLTKELEQEFTNSAGVPVSIFLYL